MPPKSYIVLGVSHRVQGEPNFIGAIHDPDYATLVSEIISSNHIDFVGEEGGDHTTVAENITTSLLGVGHYLNVEPEHPEEHGIGRIYDGYRLPSASGGGFPVLRWMVAENEKRERIWVELLEKKTVTRGLMICGFYHTFSVAAKLLNRGFEVEARTYGVNLS